MEPKFLVNFNDCLEEYISTYNSRNEKKIARYQSISICDKRTAYNILQIQPMADLVIDRDNGIYSNNSEYIEKINWFLNKSFDEEYDLVLTPEYSVPLECVEKLLKNKDKIVKGKLYCLCLHSVKKTTLTNFIDKIESEDIIILKNALNNIASGELVCCLFYITKVRFILNGADYIEKIFIAPQFKTIPMKDQNMVFESSSLSCGNNIFVFGKDDEIKFLGVICSDVFNFELIIEIKNYLSKNRAVVFHPQLNAKPQNDYFRFMREMLLSFSNDNSTRILTLNWASGTNFIFGSERQKALKNSWSAMYDKFIENEFKSYTQAFDSNARRGLNIAHDYHVVAYFFPSNEYIVSMNIRRIYKKYETIPEDIGNTAPIVVKQYFSYKEATAQFEQDDMKCSLMIDNFFNQKEFIKILNCSNCSNNCCQISKINELVASIYNRKDNKEYEIINDGKITSVTSKHYRTPYSKEKLYILKRIFNKIKNREVTANRKHLDPDFYFKLNNKDGFTYNVEYNCITEEKLKLVRIYYLQYSQKREAEQLFSDLVSKYPNSKESIIIYYEDEHGINVFPDNFSTNIASGSMFENIKNIKGGSLQ